MGVIQPFIVVAAFYSEACFWLDRNLPRWPIPDRGVRIITPDENLAKLRGLSKGFVIFLPGCLDQARPEWYIEFMRLINVGGHVRLLATDLSWEHAVLMVGMHSGAYYRQEYPC